MQMHDDRRAAREPGEAQAPRQPLAEEKVVAVVQDRGGQQLALAVLLCPGKAKRETLLAGFSRRVLHGSAVAALLQLEAAERRRGGEAERDPAPRGGRQRGQTCPEDGILFLWDHEARIAAPLARPRS